MFRFPRFLPISLATVVALCSLFAVPAGAATEKILYSFAGSPDGAYPIASLIADSSGNLYGTTQSGGANNGGTVFELVKSGSGYEEVILHSFTGYPDDGSEPQGSLVFDKAGNLYGTTYTGGAHFVGGTVFELSPNSGGSWTETILYNFQESGEGYASNPISGVFLDAHGNLYGTTAIGGSDNSCDSSYGDGCGTVFELAHVGGSWHEITLHNFSDVPDGALPWGNLVQDKLGNLYGTTIWGGSDDYSGTVFEVTPNGDGTWTETVIATLNELTGAGVSNPLGGVIFDQAGNLYGVGSSGVYELSPSSAGWNATTLYPWPGHNGPNNPTSSVVFGKSGALYGTTVWGGGAAGESCNIAGNGCGTVYEVKNSGGVWQGKEIYHFTGGPDDGWYPYSSLIPDSAGHLYGTTQYGGAYSYGTVYEITP